MEIKFPQITFENNNKNAPYKINNMSLNSNLTQLAVATSRGYRIYNIKNQGKIILCSRNEGKKFSFNGGIKLICLLLESRIISFVSCDYDNWIIIYDDIEKIIKQKINFFDSILQIYFNCKYIGANLENQIIIYNQLKGKVKLSFGGYKKQNIKHKIFHCNFLDNTFQIIYSNKKDDIIIYNDYYKVEGTIPIYKGQDIQKIFTSKDNKFLALISIEGKKIFIYDINNISQISFAYNYLWRGNSQSLVQDLIFFDENTKVAVASDHKTIHIFDLKQFSQVQYIQSLNYIKSQIKIKIPLNSPLKILILDQFSNSLHVISGNYYQHSFNFLNQQNNIEKIKWFEVSSQEDQQSQLEILTEIIKKKQKQKYFDILNKIRKFLNQQIQLKYQESQK